MVSLQTFDLSSNLKYETRDVWVLCYMFRDPFTFYIFIVLFFPIPFYLDSIFM